MAQPRINPDLLLRFFQTMLNVIVLIIPSFSLDSMTTLSRLADELDAFEIGHYSKKSSK